MTEVFIGDLRTGRRLLPLPITQGSWSTELNDAGSITATVQLDSDEAAGLDLKSAATPGKSFLAWEENDTIQEAGPIWAHVYDKDKCTLTLTAKGMWSYFDHRVLLQLAAATSPFFIPDPEDATKFVPNPALDTNLAALSLGTIAKRLVQQARAWTGGNVPVLLPADEAGIHERNYEAVDLHIIGDLLGDLTNVENGPDIEFTPRRTADRQGVEWVMRTGTNARPRLGITENPHRWDYSVPEPTIHGFRSQVSASKLTGRTWLTGGRSADLPLLVSGSSSVLTDTGFPLLELVDTSHSSVVDSATLQGYGDESVRTGWRPTEFWSFDVQGDVAPKVGEYRVGDSCRLVMGGDYYVPDGTYDRRIVSLSGTEQADWIKVTTGEVYA